MKVFSTPLLGVLSISVNLWGAELHDHHVPIPEFHKQSLLNGMEVLFLPSSEKRVPFLFMIENGAAFDPVEKWGVTYLMAEMMMERTARRTGVHIREDLQKLGAELDFRVEWDAIFFLGSSPLDNLSETLNILGEIVVRPRFEEDIFQELRDQLVREVEEQQKRIEVFTQDLFRAELFDGNPYGHPVKGNSETLKNLHLPDVKIQYRKLFMPNQAQLGLYYSGDRESFFRNLSRRWGVWIKGEPVPFTFRSARSVDTGRILLVDVPAEKSLFFWGKLGVEKSAREYYALKVFEQYLALHLPTWADETASENQVRMSVKLEAGKMPGYFQLKMQVPSDQLVLYYQKFQDFLKSVQNGRIDHLQFQEARRLAFVELKNSLRKPLARLYQLLGTSLYNLGINHIGNYGLHLNRVTPEVFQRTTQNYLSADSFLMVVAGPAHLEPQLAPLGKIGKVEFLN